MCTSGSWSEWSFPCRSWPEAQPPLSPPQWALRPLKTTISKQDILILVSHDFSCQNKSNVPSDIRWELFYNYSNSSLCGTAFTYRMSCFSLKEQRVCLFFFPFFWNQHHIKVDIISLKNKTLPLWSLKRLIPTSFWLCSVFSVRLHNGDICKTMGSYFQAYICTVCLTGSLAQTDKS